ncbi:MAG: helix-turn-helix transcriptional regulator [Bacteroidota bacterium]|nr:helix-turn-helix transcriptional regulator [Bacteroidota bacterium]MDP4237099.1 helix-turn-helix transcriptional regulator [Bacteroidota bacterium]
MTITQKQIDRSLAQKTVDVIGRIKELLKRNSMSQTQLAEIIGMEKQSISRILSYPPGSNMTLETIVKFELGLKGDILESRSFYIDEFISNPEIVIALNEAIINSDLSDQDIKDFLDELENVCAKRLRISKNGIVRKDFEKVYSSQDNAQAAAPFVEPKIFIEAHG